MDLTKLKALKQQFYQENSCLVILLQRRTSKIEPWMTTRNFTKMKIKNDSRKI